MFAMTCLSLGNCKIYILMVEQEGGGANSDFIGFAGLSLGKLETILKHRIDGEDKAGTQGWMKVMKQSNFPN